MNATESFFTKELSKIFRSLDFKKLKMYHEFFERTPPRDFWSTPLARSGGGTEIAHAIEQLFDKKRQGGWLSASILQCSPDLKGAINGYAKVRYLRVACCSSLAIF